MSTMHTTTNLRPYRKEDIPQLDGSLNRFLSQELQTLQNVINASIIAMQALEARLVAGGL